MCGLFQLAKVTGTCISCYSMSTHTSIIFIVPEFQCTPRCSRIRDPALLSHMVAARVFTHAQVPYFSLMCQRPLWSKCQRLTHHADILVRPTACRRFYNTNLLESFLTIAVCFQSVTESLTRSTEGFSAPLASLLHAISVSNNLSDFCC